MGTDKYLNMCDNVSNVRQLLQCQPVCFFNLIFNSSLTSFLNSYTSYLHLVLFQHLSKYLYTNQTETNIISTVLDKSTQYMSPYLIQQTIAKK